MRRTTDCGGGDGCVEWRHPTHARRWPALPRIIAHSLTSALLVAAACTGGEGSRRAAADSARATAAAPGGHAAGTDSATDTAPGAAVLPGDSVLSGDSLSALAATGVVLDVTMLGDSLGYRFEPDSIVLRTGDAVAFTLASGGPHNVAFWSDSIPRGAAAQLSANMPNTIRPLSSRYLMAAGESYTISFAGLPPGRYRYYCGPHLSNGMRGTIVVE